MLNTLAEALACITQMQSARPSTPEFENIAAVATAVCHAHTTRDPLHLQGIPAWDFS